MTRTINGKASFSLDWWIVSRVLSTQRNLTTQRKRAIIKVFPEYNYVPGAISPVSISWVWGIERAYIGCRPEQVYRVQSFDIACCIIGDVGFTRLRVSDIPTAFSST